MIKLTSAFLILTIFITVTLHAQKLSDLPPQTKLQVKQPDLKKVFEMETQKFKAETAAVTPKKMEKISRQTPKPGLSTKQKTWIVVAIIGAAVGIFLLVKYGKNCLEYENDCSPSEEGCYCRVYEEDND